MSDKSLTRLEEKFEKSQSDLVLQTSDFSLQGLREMVDSQVIDLAPKYQRRERWDVDRQSELIESFLLNVPVPPIYLAEEEYGIYSIIDGKQRVVAVSSYLSGKFSLKGLEQFEELNGLKFASLPKALQNALRIRPYLRVITLLKQSSPKLKYEVFIRLNRGGVRLNNQEIRNVAFRGPLNDAIYEAAESIFLRTALKIEDDKSSAFQEMQDAEYVLRFLTLKESWEDFSGNLSTSMDDFMLNHGRLQGASLKRLLQPFDAAIDRVSQLWGNLAFQRWDGERWRRQTLAGLYDAQMIAASSLGETTLRKLLGRSDQVVQSTKILFNNPSFEEAVRLGTNTPARIRLRITMMRQMLADLAE